MLTALIILPHFTFSLSTTAPKQFSGAFAYEKFTAAATSSSSAESAVFAILLSNKMLSCATQMLANKCWPTIMLCCWSCVCGLTVHGTNGQQRESLFAIAISVNNTIKYKHKFKQWRAARKVKYHHSWPPIIIAGQWPPMTDMVQSAKWPPRQTDHGCIINSILQKKFYKSA